MKVAFLLVKGDDVITSRQVELPNTIRGARAAINIGAREFIDAVTDQYEAVYESELNRLYLAVDDVEKVDRDGSVEHSEAVYLEEDVR